MRRGARGSGGEVGPPFRNCVSLIPRLESRGIGDRGAASRNRSGGESPSPRCGERRGSGGEVGPPFRNCVSLIPRPEGRGIGERGGASRNRSAGESPSPRCGEGRAAAAVRSGRLFETAFLSYRGLKVAASQPSTGPCRNGRPGAKALAAMRRGARGSGGEVAPQATEGEGTGTTRRGVLVSPGDGHAAIDHQGCARDELRLVRVEEEGRVGHVPARPHLPP